MKSACILSKTVDRVAKLEKEIHKGDSSCSFDLEPTIEGINDSLALLGHANKQVNMIRRDLLKPEMRNEYAHLCTHSLPYTNQLFGDDVSKTAKEIEECSKIGYKLQYGSGRGQQGHFRPRGGRVRGRGVSRGGFRGRGTYGTNDYQFPKNSQRRGGGRKMQN